MPHHLPKPWSTPHRAPEEGCGQVGGTPAATPWPHSCQEPSALLSASPLAIGTRG